MDPGAPAPTRFRGSLRHALRELSAFGVVGAVSFVIDLVVFQVCYASLGLGAVTSKVLATVLAMTVAYVGHRYWSFSSRPRTGIRRQYLLFAAVNGTTLLLSAGIVALVRYPLGQEDVLVLQAANILAIAVGTVVRFVSYRRWVFPSAGTGGRGDDQGREQAARLASPV